MQKTSGELASPIWLLGDSNPKNWEAVLDIPLDPRHPARHSIWTPILDEIQDTVFRTSRKRVNTHNFYIQNAIEHPDDKPKGNAHNWSEAVTQEVNEFRVLINNYRPLLLLSFGSFACEFALRAMNQNPQPYKYWSTAKLGELFRKNLASFNSTKTNLFPLLHASIARVNFLQSHKVFCAEYGTNYFQYVGRSIAATLLEKAIDIPIWIE